MTLLTISQPSLVFVFVVHSEVFSSVAIYHRFSVTTKNISISCNLLQVFSCFVSLFFALIVKAIINHII